MSSSRLDEGTVFDPCSWFAVALGRLFRLASMSVAQRIAVCCAPPYIPTSLPQATSAHFQPFHIVARLSFLPLVPRL